MEIPYFFLSQANYSGQWTKKCYKPVSLILDSCMYCCGNFFRLIFCSIHSFSKLSSLTGSFERLCVSSALSTVSSIIKVEVDFGYRPRKWRTQSRLIFYVKVTECKYDDKANECTQELDKMRLLGKG